MTPEEIKKICTEYADGLARCFPELKERNKYRDKVAQAGNVIRLILRDYYIVPKSKVKEKYAICKMGYTECEGLELGYVMDALEDIFGKDMFEEEGK